MATDYTSAGQITALAGQLAIDLRTDDSADAGADLDFAIEAGSAELDFYLSRYDEADIANSTWAQAHATYFAVRALCLRRLNEAPEGLIKECERREKQLELIRQGKAQAPRIAKTNRPGAVTNYHVDLNRVGNPIRVVRSRSTGRAQGYRRPTDDYGAVDDR